MSANRFGYYDNHHRHFPADMTQSVQILHPVAQCFHADTSRRYKRSQSTCTGTLTSPKQPPGVHFQKTTPQEHFKTCITSHCLVSNNLSGQPGNVDNGHHSSQTGSHTPSNCPTTVLTHQENLYLDFKFL